MKSTKIIFSDVHSNLGAITKVEELKKLIPNNEVIFLGDMFDRGNKAQEVLNYLVNEAKNMEVLMGNHDEMLYITLGILEERHYELLGLKSFNAKNFDSVVASSVASFFANGGIDTLNQLFPVERKLAQKLEKIANHFQFGAVDYIDMMACLKIYREAISSELNFKKLRFLCENTSYHYISDNILFSHTSNVKNTWEDPYTSKMNYGFEMHVIGHSKMKKEITQSKKLSIKGHTHKFQYGKLPNGRVLIDTKKYDNVVVM